MTARRFPPHGLQPSGDPNGHEPGIAHGLLRVARRYAETEAVRAIAAVLAVAAVVVLAGLAWLWVFGK
jgi:hypothetical protein